MSGFPESPLEVGLFDWIEWSDRPASEIFQHKLALVEGVERHGFYAWQIAEHQGTPLSIDISPSFLLAAAAQRTSRLRMGALVFCLPWYNPFRFHNEVCMLDHLLEGRLELGVGRGVSLIESRTYGIESPEESRDRYRETLDIFFRACESDVLNYQGKFHQYKDVELYNRPYQRPYPPLWFPSSDRNSIDFTASHGYHTCVNFGTAAEIRELLDQCREVWLQHKNDAGRHNGQVPAPKLGQSIHVVVAGTDDEALRLMEPAHQTWADRITYLFRKNNQGPPLRDLDFASRTEKGQAVYGSATVLQRLTEQVKATGINYLLMAFSFGDLTPPAAMESLERFGSEVLPSLKTALP